LSFGFAAADIVEGVVTAVVAGVLTGVWAGVLAAADIVEGVATAVAADAVAAAMEVGTGGVPTGAVVAAALTAMSGLVKGVALADCEPINKEPASIVTAAADRRR